jgi:hypothetical protein
MFHPAFIVRNWGDAEPNLRIDGTRLNWGPNYRFGRVFTLEGTNLVVWVNSEATKPVRLEITSGQ